MLDPVAPGACSASPDASVSARNGSSADPLTSYAGPLVPVAPGAYSASPDASVATHSGSTADPLSSCVGPLVPVTPGAYSVASDTSHPEVLFAAFDWGARASSRRCAYAWCLWSSARVLLRWEARSFAAFQTNNVMEAQGLLACLRWLRIHFPSHPVYIFGDFRVIINQATCVFVCREPSLGQWLSAIRALDTAGTLGYLHHVRRAYNVASDALCNWMMDAPVAQYITSTGDRWPCPPPAARPLSSAVVIPFQPPVIIPNVDLLAHKKATWSLVVQEFESVVHLVRLRFAPASVDGPFHPVVHLPPPPPRIWTAARSLPSSFSTHSTRTCCVYGRSRYVPRLVFEALRAAANRIGVDFPLDSAFLTPGPGPLSVPDTYLRILDAFVADPELGIAGALGLFWGQTVADPRPNKALRPWLYRVHLAWYPDLELLCAIAEDGLTPPCRDPSRRDGVRPVPSNYPGASTGATIVPDKLLADHYKGRCFIARMDTLTRDPHFHSRSFALVPKNDAPLHLDRRIIHDLSAPNGLSVNTQTASEASLDASWDPFVSIARRVCELRSRYPGYTVYAMIVDIAEAFHHVPVHARHASTFGGCLPRSSHGIVSAMAVFGWTSSPGFFAEFGKAVRH